MSELLAQHGTAKGKKLINGFNSGSLHGVIFSINDENFDSINTYININNDIFNKDNSFLDPQFYYSAFDPVVRKKITDIECFPSNMTRRDWRKKDENLMDYIKFHADLSKKISNTLVTPGLYIDNIDWHFDNSVEIYNHCIEHYDFTNFALSLLIHSSFFNNRKNVIEIIEELNELSLKKDFLYLTICYDNNSEPNYEDIDPNCLSNILSFINKAKKIGYKIIMGYGFLNSILFAMLDCDYIASGWFNTLRKFQKNKLEMNDIFGRRKKRYTSTPLLSYITFEDIGHMVDSGKITKSQLLSQTSLDEVFLKNQDALSFVDLEQQYWESLSNIFQKLNECGSLNNRINYVKELIENAVIQYEDICTELNKKEEKIALSRIKSISKHLYSWQIAIDLFVKNEMIIL
jgi:hypothetical protein